MSKMNGEEDFRLVAECLHILTREQAWEYRVVPKEVKGDTLVLLAAEGTETDIAVAELEILLGKTILLETLPETAVSRLLAKYYIRESSPDPIKKDTFRLGDDFLLQLIEEAKNLKSSDIHIERYEKKCRVRIRIDGVMIERYHLKSEEYPSLVNKIKIQANLDIAEKRLPQDGRINFNSNRYQFDIRVSVLPALYGEKIVLRLLNNDATDIELDTLGFSDIDYQNYLHAVMRPNGIMLISGPTGSGKTTTLYATLKLLNKDTRNILTIEDPVEYTLEGINQVQLKESIGLNFAAALRTFLRQDPDVIMVGEIRDTETANMAIRAALTGHLVLSTIHTNSAWGTVSRLTDMGVPSFLVANTLNTTVAQRLLRLLCPMCKRSAIFEAKLYPRQFNPYRQISTHFEATGCEHCHFTGYKGRKAVYEVIPIDQELALEIKKGTTSIQGHLKERGISTLSENAFNLFADGLTSLEEIYPLLLNY